MKKSILLLILFAAVEKLFCQQDTLSFQQIHSSITVTLNDRLKTLDGFLETNYTNLSSDTLSFIWFQVWPNAFKNDRTAFSEYMLQKDRTDFYFSSKEKRGYINRLDFRTEGMVLNQVDHPQYIDVIKVILDKPLLPDSSVTVATPFHVKLPFAYDSIGYLINNNFILKHWYPVPALYNRSGWHPMTFAGQESITVADYEVSLTLRKRFHVESNVILKDSSMNDSLQTLQFSGQQLNDVSFNIYIKKPAPELPYARHFPPRRDISKSILSKKFFPLAGYNRYDGLQLGYILHEPDTEKPFNYFAVPMFALSSSKIVGHGGMDFRITPLEADQKQYIDLGVNIGTFSTMEGRDSINKKIYSNVYKIVPFVQWRMHDQSPKIIKQLEFRSFIMSEQGFDYKMYSVDSFYYPTTGKRKWRYINQLTFGYANKRVLYPYDAQLQLQQGQSFYRINATAHYFFNYPESGGIQLRLFAAKFGYLGALSSAKKFETFQYQPKLTAVRGDEDYTYGDYFFGRNDFEGFNSNQIMIRDGGLKLRTDLFSDLQGRSDNWIAAINLNSTLPQIFPVAVPLKVFLDVGTYAGAWKRETSTPRFMYVSGLQLSLFKELVNIYAPLLYSNQFRDRLKSVSEENTFMKRLSFSINVQHLKLNRTQNFIAP